MHRRKYPLAFLYVCPFLIAYMVLQIYPLIYSLYLSFTDYEGFGTPNFIGLDNYFKVLKVDGETYYRGLIVDPLFWKSAFNTLRQWGIAFTLQLSSAMFLSAIFYYSKIKGKSLFRAIFYFPNFITVTTIAVLFGNFFGYEAGVFNYLLAKLHLIDEPVRWLSNKVFVATATPMIIWWLWFGQTAIILYAGMTTIPKDYYEAAKIEGVSDWQSYFNITVPLLRPTILYVLITALIGGLQHYDLAAFLTSGGAGNPDSINLTMMMYMYNKAFVGFRYGYGSAVAVGIFFIIQLCAGIMFYWYLTRKNKI